MFEIAQKADARAIIKRLFSYFCFGLVTTGLFLALLGRDAIHTMATQTFWPADRVVPVVVLAYVIYGLFLWTHLGILVANRTGYLGAVSLVAALSNIAFNWLLIPRWGMMGAAWATVLSFAVRFVGAYVASQRLMPIPYDWARALKMASAAMLVYILSHWISVDGLLTSVMVNVLLLSGFLFCSYKMNILSAEQKRHLVRLVQHPIAAIK